jgi:hypothetical protein
MFLLPLPLPLAVLLFLLLQVTRPQKTNKLIPICFILCSDFVTSLQHNSSHISPCRKSRLHRPPTPLLPEWHQRLQETTRALATLLLSHLVAAALPLPMLLVLLLFQPGRSLTICPTELSLRRSPTVHGNPHSACVIPMRRAFRCSYVQRIRRSSIPQQENCEHSNCS